jgi:hypothetical protein
MKFEFTDKRAWKYVFTVDESNQLFIEVESFDEQGHKVHREDVAFYDDVFNWRPYHTRGDTPLVSPEAREFCERHVKSYMKMKVFW